MKQRIPDSEYHKIVDSPENASFSGPVQKHDEHLAQNKTCCCFCQSTISVSSYEYTVKFIVTAYEFYQKYMAKDDVLFSERQVSPFYHEQLNQTQDPDWIKSAIQMKAM